MSHAAHSETHAVIRPSGTIGISSGALLFVLVSIIAATIQGSFVVSAAHTGKVWPSINSTTIPLPPMNLTP